MERRRRQFWLQRELTALKIWNRFWMGARLWLTFKNDLWKRQILTTPAEGSNGCMAIHPPELSFLWFRNGRSIQYQSVTVNIQKTKCSFSSGQVWTKFPSRTAPAGANVRQPRSFTRSSLTQPAEHLLSKIHPTNYALILEAPISVRLQLRFVPFIAAVNKWDCKWRCTVMLGVIFQHCGTHRASPPAH